MKIEVKKIKLTKTQIKQMFYMSFSTLAKDHEIKPLGFVNIEKIAKIVIVYDETLKDYLLVEYGWTCDELNSRFEKNGRISYKFTKINNNVDIKTIFSKYEKIINEANEKGHIYL